MVDRVEQIVNKLQVSVLLPVYNGEVYLEEAIQSILDQTYDNFELVIINDGSTDQSASIIQKFNDSRIRLFTQKNQGLAAALNRAVNLANGIYLARQDQDDISLPERLEKQVAFLERNPNCGMVGTWAEIWEKTDKTKRSHKHPVESQILKFELLFGNPFVHSSVMIRKTVFETVGLYSTDTSRQPPEDYELWSRVAREFEVANIPEILHIYREVPNSISRVEFNPILDRVVNISAENLANVLGKAAPEQNVINLAALAQGAFHRLTPKVNFTDVTQLFFEVVDSLNSSSGILPSELMKVTVMNRLQILRGNYLRYRYGKVFGRLISLFFRLGVLAK